MKQLIFQEGAWFFFELKAESAGLTYVFNDNVLSEWKNVKARQINHEDST